MNTINNRKILIQFVALIGVIINVSYGLELLNLFFAPQYSNSIKEILISAIALEFAWAILLFWVILKPFERKKILLITAITMMLGNILHSLNQYSLGADNISTISLNLFIGSLIAGLFVFASVLKNAKEASP